MNSYIEVTELSFADRLPRELVLNTASIRTAKPWFIGTLLVVPAGFFHVRETAHQIRELIQHAREYQYAMLADLVPDPDEELFATAVIAAPVYVRNTIHSGRENLTLNEVDLVGLIEQHDRMADEFRAEALGE